MSLSANIRVIFNTLNSSLTDALQTAESEFEGAIRDMQAESIAQVKQEIINQVFGNRVAPKAIKAKRGRPRSSDPAIVALVIELHDKRDMSFRKIAEELGARRLSTVSGVPWTMANVAKLHSYASMKAKMAKKEAKKAAKPKRPPNPGAILRGRYMGLMRSASKTVVKMAKNINASSGIKKAIKFMTGQRVIAAKAEKAKEKTFKKAAKTQAKALRAKIKIKPVTMKQARKAVRTIRLAKAKTVKTAAKKLAKASKLIKTTEITEAKAA